MLDRDERSTVGIALLCLGICLTFQAVVSLLPAGDFRALFFWTSMDLSRHNGGSHATSQGLATVTTVTTILSATKSYAPVSVQPPSNSQLPASPPPLQQSIKADSVGDHRTSSSSAGLCSKNFFDDSAFHNSEGSTTATMGKDY